MALADYWVAGVVINMAGMATTMATAGTRTVGPATAVAITAVVAIMAAE